MIRGEPLFLMAERLCVFGVPISVFYVLMNTDLPIKEAILR